jgi:hypothetical protein
MFKHFHDKFKLIHVTKSCINAFTLEVWRLFHKEQRRANMSSYQTRGVLDARSELVAPWVDVESVMQAHTDTTI